MRISGTIRDGRRIVAEVPGFRVNGLAVSSDGQTIYITATTPQNGGVLLSIPAFGGGVRAQTYFSRRRAWSSSDHDRLRELRIQCEYFAKARARARCSMTRPVRVATPHRFQEVWVCWLDSRSNSWDASSDGSFDDLSGKGGPVARAHSVAELGLMCDRRTGVPPEASVVSSRNAMTLRGDGLLDTIALGDVLANMALEPAAVRGRPNLCRTVA